MLRMMKEAIGEDRGLQSVGRERRVTFCQGLGDDFQAGALLFVSKTLAPLPDYMDPINSGKGCQTLPPVLGVCYGYLGFYAEIAPSTADCLLYLEGGQSFAAASCAVAVGYTVSRMGGAEQGMAAAAGSCAQLFRGGAIGSSTDVVGGAEAAKQAQKVKVENPEREGGNIDYFGTGSMSPFRVMPKVKTTSRHLSAGPQCTHAHAHKLVAGQGSTQALRRGLKKVRMKKPKPHLKEPMAVKLEAVASALVVSEAQAALAEAEEKGTAAALRVAKLDEKLRLSEAREARAEAAPAQAACEDDAGGVLAGSSFGRVGAAIDGRHPPERCPSTPISFLQHTLPQPGWQRNDTARRWPGGGDLPDSDAHGTLRDGPARAGGRGPCRVCCLDALPGLVWCLQLSAGCTRRGEEQSWRRLGSAGALRGCNCGVGAAPARVCLRRGVATCLESRGPVRSQ